MIQYHPTESMLLQHINGELDSSVSLVVAAHVDMCPHCQAQVEKLEQQQASALEITAPLDLDSANLDAMLAQIMAQPMAAPAPAAKPISPRIEFHDQVFSLPRPLARLAQKRGEWKRRGTKLWQADVPLGEGMPSANLMFLDAGSRIPAHTHRGQELTLVIDGVLHDELGTYRDGDLLVRDTSDNHSPYTDDKYSCLCFAVQDAPIQFTQGLARLLNPLLN